MSLLLGLLNGFSKVLNQQNDVMDFYDATHPGNRERLSNAVDGYRRREILNMRMQHVGDHSKTTNSQSSNGGGALALGALAVVGIGAAALMKKVLSDDKGNDKTNSSTASVLCKESVSDTATNCPICKARILNGEKTCNVCGFQL